MTVFSLPKVQTWAAQKATTAINKKYHTDISIEQLGISYAGAIKAKGIFVRDHHNDTLVDAKVFSTSIANISDLISGNGKLSNANFENLYVKMKVYKGEDKDNFRIFIDNFLPKEKKKTTKPFNIAVKQLNIKDGHYLITNENIKNEPIVEIKNINLSGNNFKVEGADISLHSEKLSLIYNNAINVTNLETYMQLSKNLMKFSDLRLKTDQKSDIIGDLLFAYETGDMSDFVNKVRLSATITKSKLATNDLQYFYKKFGRNELIKLTTKFTGTMNDFDLKDLRLSGLRESSIVGDARLLNSFSKNLIEDFEIKGSLKQMTTSRADLSNLLPSILGVHLPKKLGQLGQVNLVGKVTATPTSVDIDANVFTQIGSVLAVLKMDELTTPSKATYVGNLGVTDFDLGTYTQNPKLGKASFNMDVNGKGFLLKDVNTNIEGNFSKFEYNGYSYSDISIIGELNDPLFDGHIIAKDPNLNLTFNGLVNVSELENDYDFSSNIEYIDFNKLNLFSRDSISVFKGNVVANMKGTTIDNARGTISIKNTQYTNQNDTYSFDDFQISSSFSKEDVRTIKINSPDIITGKIEGKFRFKNIKNLFQNSIASLYKNYQAITTTDTEFVNFNFNIYNKIVDVFFPDISLAPNTFIKGSVSSNESKFKLNFESPEIGYKENSASNFNVQVDNTNPLYNGYVTIDKIKSKYYPVSDFSLINVSLNDTLYVRSEFKGGKMSKDEFDLNAFHTINERNNSIVGIQKSSASFKGNKWYVNEKNDQQHLIEFDNNFKDVKIDSIKINHNNERIAFNGIKKDSTYKDLKLRFSNVDLQKITPSIDSLSYRGIVDGDLTLLQKEGAYFPETNITISDFIINDLGLGDLVMNVIGNSNLTSYFVDSYIKGKESKPVSVKGGINVEGKNSTIDLDVTFDRFNLAPFSPLGGIVLSKLRGELDGIAKVSGNYKNPDINGTLNLNKAGLKIPYLNVDLDIAPQSKVYLSKQEFKFVNTSLTDTKYATKGRLNGSISHKKFKKWNLDLKIDSDRLLVLNTSEKDNDLYYGTAFIDGEATIKGPTDKLFIAVSATSEKGTKFKIPLSDAESVGDNSFVHFITPEEKLAKKTGREVFFEDVKGLELQFDLDLNENAEVEVVIDKASGSTLKGYGAGTLLIEINTKGKFNMWGDFVAYKGTYDFKYGGLLSKRFDVLPEGSIGWEDGSPTGARLNLSAVYKTKANPAILLENSTINRKIPVEVVTTLQGDLLKPNLSFDIKFPGISSIVKSELDYILADRTIKERQAFSLITQGQFYSDALIGQNAITGNLVEHASTIVNSIFADDDDKLNFGFDYVPGDRTRPDSEISDRFGVSVSTQISNRILINGKVGVPVGGVNESVVVGDVEIEFLLNEDGTLRATIFNREDDIQFIGEADGYTQGVGLSYSYDFDTFKELLRKIFADEKRKAKREEKNTK